MSRDAIAGRRGSPRACRAAGLLLLLAAAGFAAGAGRARAGATAPDTLARPATPAAGWRATRVSYLAGASVYLEAGRDDGLTEGDSAWVVREGRRVAALRVAFLSTRRAACDTLWTKVSPAVGDEVAFRAAARVEPRAGSEGAAAARADSVRDAAVLAPPGARAAARDASLRGRLGVRWLGVESDGARRTSQPAMEARFDARDGLGGHLDVVMDVRGRRTLRTHDGGRWLEQYSRVYRAAASVRDAAARRRLTLGRQSSPTLASVSLFDGALAEWNGTRHGLGAFAGTQPDPLRFGWSDEIVEAGAFAEVHQAPLARDRWSLAAGAVSSWHGRQVDRDFMFLQGWWFARGASASLAQELDLNRGWKRAAGEPPLSWTSTFAAVRVPAGRRVTLHSGFDNRRSVRLWRDRETPETEFDDRYRQGAWLGAQVDWTDLLTNAVEVRTGSGGERTDAWSASGELHRATRWRALLRVRVASFTAQQTESGLWSLAAGFDPESRSHVEVSHGSRWTRDRVSGFGDTERWTGVDVDFALGQRWYATGGFERLTAPSGSTRQVQAGLSVRL
jgi:hypothetical protein